MRAVRFLGRFVRRTVLVVLWLGLVAVVVGLAGSWWAIDRLQLDVSRLPVLTAPERVPLPQPIRVYSADDVLIGSTARQRRVLVNGRSMARSVREATLAIEDQRFYRHRGVDVQSLLRAVWVDVRSGGYRQGASTLTMQYVRNVYLDRTKTTDRKLREVALALQLESVWDKDRILTAYLNTVYYGNGAYGIEAAAQEYFRRSADDLSVSQAAMLAGVTNDPTGYDPRRNRDAAWRRARLIIDEMFAQDRISRAEWLAARVDRPRVRASVIEQKIFDRQLWEAGTREARRRVGETAWAAGGLNVRLTLRMTDQRAARKTLERVYRGTPAPRPVIAATFVEPSTGRILSMASSRTEGFFDYARQARRQPGSTVKLFTTAAYFERGGQTVDPIDNSPLRVRDGRRSYTVEPTSSGVDDVGEALRLSQNPAFWRLYSKAGPARVLALQRRLGLRGMDDNPAAALGGVRYGVSTAEMAGAMGGFANDGRLHAPHLVEGVSRRGDDIHVDSDRAPRRALDTEYARRLNQAGRSVVSDGLVELRRSVSLSRTRQISGKTGTTEDNGDAWFVGYSPNLAGAVWTGYPRSRQSLRNVGGVSGEVFGATVPARAWNRLAGRFFRRLPVERFKKPTGAVEIPEVVGRRVEAGVERLRAYGLTSIRPVPVFNPRARASTILSVDPDPGAFVKPSTPVRVRYQRSSRPTPDLLGRSYLSVYETLGRYVRIRPKIVPSTKPTGTILSQFPTPGESIAAGDTLQLTLATRRAPARIVTKRVEYVPTRSELARLRRRLSASRARETASDATRIVPDIVGLTPIDAGQVLSSIGLDLGGRSTGRIVAQTPAAGSRVGVGRRIATEVVASE